MTRERRFFRLLLLLPLLLVLQGCLGDRPSNSAAPREELSVYPEAEPVGKQFLEWETGLVFNPRVPCVPPVAGGRRGKCLPADKVFVYRLAPWMGFPEGGRVTVAVRDDLRRNAKELLALGNDDTTLALRVGPAAEGRVPALVLEQTGRKPVAAEFAHPITGQWTAIELRWDPRRATLLVETQEVAHVELTSSFVPTSVRCRAFSVDELAVEGAGRLQLDWEDGYAARMTPAPTAEDIRARLFGFDAFVVSREKTARDFPMVQVLAAGAGEKSIAFDFDVRSEVRQLDRRWTQSVNVRGTSAVMIPISFPFPLETDVYHLTVKSHGLASEVETARDFMFVARRDEPAGPPKFGLHLGGGSILGCWPDALPIHLYHYYANWGYIQGPVWVTENGQRGLDPAVPPAEWYWDPHLDWAVAQGLEPYVCLNAAPLLPWMCDKLYATNGMPGPWPSASPKDEHYRKFVHALAERYQGKVRLYEVQNEPNAYPPGGYPPADYVAILKAFFEEMHAVNPRAVVYGICGTSDFVPWMTKVFEAGGAAYMDRLSFHTYTTPTLPDQAGLSDRLAEVRALATRYGKPLRFINSETGTYVALREEVDRPISAQRLAELIAKGTPALAVPSGWPNYALTERTGSLSAVRNAVINFLAGTEYFTFFGWNPEWPATNWWTKGDDQCFAVISCTKDGRRTPSLYTLAIGVLTAQMEGALPATGVTVNEGGIAGGRFAKQNGGQVAVLWSSLGKRGVVVETADPAPELVSLFGESSRLSASRSRGRYCYRVELTEQPVYIQVKSADLRLLPSPVVNVRPTGREGNVYRVAFALVNRYGKPWAGRVELAAPAGWQIEPATPGFDLASGARREVELQCTVPPLTPRGDHPVEASLTLPDGNRFTFPIEVSVRPSFTAARLPPDVKLTDLGAWEMPGGALQLDRPEQVTMGRPPLLAALQEQKYWQGPAELSGRVKVGYNADGLLVYIRAHDANLRLPATWPGVGGSCVELFFDFRPATDGLGRGAYEQGVYQVILKPSLAADQPVEIWNASQQYGILKDLTVAGGRIDAANYWVALRIPWANISGGMHPGYAFNFDVGLDGSLPNTPGRKSQIMLFGNANNCLNASDFGSGTLAPPAPNRP